MPPEALPSRPSLDKLRRRAKELLESAGADVLYREYPRPHTVDPSFLAELRPWLERATRAL